MRTDPTEIFHRAAVASLILLAAGLVLLMVDTRTLPDGEAVWLKPVKFAVSFVMLFATLAVATHFLGDAWRNARLTRLAAWISLPAFAYEIGYISIQAGRAQASHFNDSAPVYELLYSLMGVGAALLMLVILGIAYGVARDRRYGLASTARWSIVAGFVLSAALTNWIGGELGGNGGHLVGRPVTGAAVPILGWSLEVGDLRPAHFLSLHAMQIIPLVGFSVHVATGEVRSRLPLVLAFAALYTAATIAVFHQAKDGLPIWSAVESPSAAAATRGTLARRPWAIE